MRRFCLLWNVQSQSRTLGTSREKHFFDAAYGIAVSTELDPNGRVRPYLGAALGSQEYVIRQVESKVNDWIANLQCLATIAKTQPHAAFSALTHGLISKWTYLSRTIPDIGPLLRPLDDALCSVLLPTLTGRPPPGDLERTLFAMPARLGGLGIPIPSRTATQEFHSSLFVTSTLCDHIISQDPE